MLCILIQWEYNALKRHTALRLNFTYHLALAQSSLLAHVRVKKFTMASTILNCHFWIKIWNWAWCERRQRWSLIVNTMTHKSYRIFNIFGTWHPMVTMNCHRMRRPGCVTLLLLCFTERKKIKKINRNKSLDCNNIRARK